MNILRASVAKPSQYIMGSRRGRPPHRRGGGAFRGGHVRSGVIMKRCRWWRGATLALALVVSVFSRGLAAGPAPLSNASEALAQLAKDLADQSLPVAQRLDIIRALGGWGGTD